MSVGLNIFVASDNEISEFANELAEIFETEVGPIEDEDCLYGFVKFNGELSCSICNNIHNNSDVSDKRYQLDLWIHVRGPKSRARDERIKMVLYVFNKLMATRKYSLLATYNFDEVLARFDLDED